jgi:hypothetical protein
MVAMRDGTRLNTFVFLPESGGPRWPVILHRTPYGIAASDAADKTDCSRAWLPSAEEPFRGSILRGWRNMVAHLYAAVYQDTRRRHGSEGEDRVYADEPPTVAIPSNGSPLSLDQSDGGHVHRPRAPPPPPPPQRGSELARVFAQAGASSIYDDVV